MEPTLLQIDKKTLLPEILKYPTNSFYVSLARIFDIDQTVIQIYNNKDIKLLG